MWLKKLCQSKSGFHINIEQETLDNTDFRRVLYTTANSQLVLMSLKPDEDIGIETHGVDQFFRFEEGEGKVIINGTEYKVKDGDSVTVPSGSEHNVINTSDSEDLKMYTVYSPPHHAKGTIHRTKSDVKPEEFDGTNDL